MAHKDHILSVLYAVIDQTNTELPEGRRLVKSPDTVLFGGAAALDSLGLVNFIVAAEQEIREKFAAPVSLTDERAMSQKNSPFRTVNSLADYLSTLLHETRHE